MNNSKKQLYQNQKEIQKELLEEITSKYVVNNQNISQVFLQGSLANHQFGKYQYPCRDDFGVMHPGSKINLLIIQNNSQEVPKTWRKLESLDWSDKYLIGEVDFDGVYHKVEGLVHSITKHKDYSDKLNKNLLLEYSIPISYTQ